jgi:dTDP-4-dehydrorhamnose 3,5-epimerase-like enzyme
MIVRPSSLSGLALIEPRFFSDSRGSFYESWNDRRFREAGIIDYFQPDDEAGIAWNDPTLAVPWPIANPFVSPRDQAFPTFAAATRGLTVP